MVEKFISFARSNGKLLGVSDKTITEVITLYYEYIVYTLIKTSRFVFYRIGTLAISRKKANMYMNFAPEGQKHKTIERTSTGFTLSEKLKKKIKEDFSNE